MANRLEKLAVNLGKVNIPEIIADILRNQKILNEIVEIVQNRLYNEGTDSDGKKFRTDSANIQGNAAYAGFTYQVKRKKGQRARNVTFRDTGGFYRSMKAQVPFKSVQITGDFEVDFGHIYDNFRSSYSGEKQFEDAVLGLTDTQLEYVAWELVYPELMTRLRKITDV
jgi:hypothetical protein